MNKVVVGQALRFAVVGGISTIVNYAIYYALYKGIALHYQLSSAVGFMTGVAVGYSLNKYWTFGVVEKKNQEVAKYFAVYLVSLLLSLAFLHLTVELVGINPNIANFFAICLTTVTNFLGTKFLVFKV